MSRKTILTAAAAAVAATALSLGPVATASAHVSASSSSSTAGTSTTVTFSVPHGCGGSATTKIAVQIPEGINSATPTRNPLYTLQKVTEKLDTPITDSHGNQVTERVAQVVWTATTPLPDGERDVFQLSLTLPAAEAETTVYFPTVQTCEVGEVAWVQIPAEGQDPHSLAAPAPAVTIAPGTDGHGSDDHGSGDQGTGDQYTGEAVAQDSSSVDGLSIAALVVGILGLLAGGFALLRSRKA